MPFFNRQSAAVPDPKPVDPVAVPVAEIPALDLDQAVAPVPLPPASDSPMAEPLPETAPSLQPSQPAVPLPTTSLPAMVGDTSMTILLAEDDTVLQELYSEAFTDAGLTVLQAFDGPSALHMVEDHPEIRLLLLDLMLPKLSGYDVLAQIRMSGRKDLPVIIVSALSDIDDQARGLQLGATDYITKGEMLPSAVIEKIKSYAVPVPGTAS